MSTLQTFLISIRKLNERKSIMIKNTSKYLLHYIIFNVIASGLLFGLISLEPKIESGYLFVICVILTFMFGPASFIAWGLSLPNLGTEYVIAVSILTGALFVWLFSRSRAGLKSPAFLLLCIFWLFCGYIAYTLYIIGP